MNMSHSTVSIAVRRHLGIVFLATLVLLSISVYDQATLQVVVTTNIVGDTVRNVVGDAADLEGRMGNVLAQMARRTPTFAVTEYMTLDELLLDPDWATADPHAWFDLLLWKKAVLRVRDAMSEADPGLAST